MVLEIAAVTECAGVGVVGLCDGVLGIYAYWYWDMYILGEERQKGTSVLTSLALALE